MPSTLAPNVGPPHFVPVDRRDTGYVSLDQPTVSRLETPEEFRRSTRGQASPVRERYSGDNHNLFGTMHAPNNVTFRGVTRKGYDSYSPSSDDSDEDFFRGPNSEPGGHLGGGSSGGAKPRHKAPPLGGAGNRLASGRCPSGGARAPPSRMAGLGPALWRDAPPLDPPDFDHHGYWAELPEEMDEVVDSRRHRRHGRSAGGVMPRRRSSPSDEARNRQSNRHTNHVLPTLKLVTFNGSKCLKTFLAKFENCSDYYEWTEEEKLCHLRASLEGPVGQVLWDTGQQSSVDEVVGLLKNRFGCLSEEERYRSELKARRRRREESLQSVYQDVRRLMALAFPGQSGSMWEIMARDAFVESLDDPSLRIRVLERYPTTLEEALKIASLLEALGAGDLEESWNDLGRRKEKFVKISAADDHAERQELVSRVEELNWK